MTGQILVNLKRRLQKHKETEALHGYNTPPEILLEIEDLTRRIAELESGDSSGASLDGASAAGASVVSVTASGQGSIAIGTVAGDVIIGNREQDK